MIQTEVKEIDGTSFEVRGLDLRTERAVLIRVMKAVGPALSELGAGATSTPKALGMLLSTLDEAEVEYLCTTFAKVTRIQVEVASGGSWVPLVDAAFKNGVSTQIKWLWFCLEHQFGAFLGDEGAGLLQSLKAKASP